MWLDELMVKMTLLTVSSDEDSPVLVEVVYGDAIDVEFAVEDDED